MAENTNDHRFARAAGRAARAFREGQAQQRAARSQDPQTAQQPRTSREPQAPGGPQAPEAPRDSHDDGARPRPADRARSVASQAAVVRERTTRAAGEATRAFRENQAKDDARLKEIRTEVRTSEEARLAEKRAHRERELEERDAAEAGLVHPLLRLARLWWLIVTVLLLALTAAFTWNGRRAAERGGEVVDPLTGIESVGPLGGATGQYLMAGVVAALALVSLWGWIGLLRRRRAAIGTLTFIAALCLVPALLRMNALLILLAAVLTIGAVLVWLPPVRSRVRR